MSNKRKMCTSLYTSSGRGNLRNDIHALLNLSFIFLATLLEPCKETQKKERRKNNRKLLRIIIRKEISQIKNGRQI